MDKQSINIIEQDCDLGGRYEGQHNEQPCYLLLETDKGRMYTYTAQTSSGCDQRVFDGVDIRWQIPALTAARANELLSEVKADAAEICFGDDQEADEAAHAAIRAACDSLMDDESDGRHHIISSEGMDGCDIRDFGDLDALVEAHQAGDAEKVAALRKELIEGLHSEADRIAKDCYGASCSGSCCDAEQMVDKAIKEAIEAA